MRFLDRLKNFIKKKKEALGFFTSELLFAVILLVGFLFMLFFSINYFKKKEEHTSKKFKKESIFYHFVLNSYDFTGFFGHKVQKTSNPDIFFKEYYQKVLQAPAIVSVFFPDDYHIIPHNNGQEHFAVGLIADPRTPGAFFEDSKRRYILYGVRLSHSYKKLLKKVNSPQQLSIWMNNPLRQSTLFKRSKVILPCQDCCNYLIRPLIQEHNKGVSWLWKNFGDKNIFRAPFLKSIFKNMLHIEQKNLSNTAALKHALWKPPTVVGSHVSQKGYRLSFLSINDLWSSLRARKSKKNSRNIESKTFEETQLPGNVAPTLMLLRSLYKSDDLLHFCQCFAAQRKVSFCCPAAFKGGPCFFKKLPSPYNIKFVEFNRFYNLVKYNRVHLRKKVMLCCCRYGSFPYHFYTDEEGWEMYYLSGKGKPCDHKQSIFFGLCDEEESLYTDSVIFLTIHECQRCLNYKQHDTYICFKETLKKVLDRSHPHHVFSLTYEDIKRI